MRVWTNSVEAPSSHNGNFSNMAQTVDLDSTRMRLGDEKNLRVKVAKALLDQKELLEKRQVHNVALERNFGILREISEK